MNANFCTLLQRQHTYFVVVNRPPLAGRTSKAKQFLFSPELSFSASRLTKQKGEKPSGKKERKKKKRDRIYERRQEKGKMRKKVRKLFSIFRGRLSVLFPRPIPSHLFFFFLATFFAKPLCSCQANVAIKTHAISLLSIIFLHLDTHLEINLARNSCEETWHLSMLMAIL